MPSLPPGIVAQLGTTYTTLSLDLGIARDNVEVEIDGDVIAVLAITGELDLRLNEKDEPIIELDKFIRLVTKPARFRKLYFTNAAQAGKSATLYIGREASFEPWPQRSGVFGVLDSLDNRINPAKEDGNLANIDSKLPDKSAAKEHQPRLYYKDHFDIDDAWLWNLKAEGSIADSILTLSPGQERSSSRFHQSFGSLLTARMRWGILAQTGADRWMGWGTILGVNFVGFRIAGTAVRCYVRQYGVDKYVDVTASMPADYDTAYHDYIIIIDKGVARFLVDNTLLAEIEVPQLTPYFRNEVGLSARIYDTITGDIGIDQIRIAYFEPRPSLDPQAHTHLRTFGTFPAGTNALQWSYTVPDGRSALVEVVGAWSDTEAVGNVRAEVYISGGPVLAEAGQYSGVRMGLKHVDYPRMLLLPGQTIAGWVQNADTVSHYLAVYATVTEME